MYKTVNMVKWYPENIFLTSTDGLTSTFYVLFLSYNYMFFYAG